MSPLVNGGVSVLVYFYHFYFILKRNSHLSYANNNADPCPTPRVAASDLSQHCLAICLYGIQGID